MILSDVLTYTVPPLRVESSLLTLTSGKTLFLHKNLQRAPGMFGALANKASDRAAQWPS